MAGTDAPVSRSVRVMAPGGSSVGTGGPPPGGTYGSE
jgi:hypothetical protein